MAVPMHVAQSGPAGAPTVVLLHCMGRTGAMWDPHRVALSERFRVIAPDLPGHGQSPGPFTVAASVDALAGLVAQLDSGGPVHLVGLSLGARVALKFASEQSVASLALLGCGIGPIGGLRVLISRALPARFYPPGPDKVSKQVVIASMAELATLDLASCPAKVTARTLVVSGEKDRPYHPDAQTLVQEIPDAQLRVIPGAEHLWPDERVEEFVSLVTGWVAPGASPGQPGDPSSLR